MDDTDDISIGADDSKHMCNGFTHYSSSPVKRQDSLSFKIFRDPVHGQIELHPACVAIIDTPQFQRLRDIKQTGLLDYVFPGATHNRFGHSLGVCHLANKFVRDLRERQPELGITDIDVLCIQIAGLCHDLGHGPLSHLWEAFMNANSKQRGLNFVWKHETVSINMLDYLIAENKLEAILKKYGIGRKEIAEIKDYITGTPSKETDKAFLYQIVNNDHSGLDVDKWDYFLRDSLYLGLPSSFEYERIIQCSKVMTVDGKTQICFRDKVAESIYNIFRTRSKLHKLAYQHRVLIIIDEMFLDALLIADSRITGPSGEILQLWEWSKCAAFCHGVELYKALQKYTMLTDSLVLSCLKHCKKPEVLPAVSLMEAIEKRSQDKSGFYQLVVHTALPFECDENEILNGISEFLPIANAELINTSSEKHSFECSSAAPVTKDDVCVCVVPINWGKGDKNPVDYVNFYSKNFPGAVDTKNLNLSTTLLPQKYQEIVLQVLSRRNDDYSVEIIRLAFENYWNCFTRKTRI